jgi:hypothetical protein
VNGLVQIVSGNGSFVPTVPPEMQQVFYRESLRTYDEYFQFIGTDGPLDFFDLNAALRRVWLIETVDPDRPIGAELARISVCIDAARTARHRDEALRQLEIRFHEVCSRDFAHSGNLSDAATEYLKMADLIQEAADELGPRNSSFQEMMRRKSGMLMNAAGLNSQLQQRRVAIQLIEKACAVHLQLLQLFPESDLDAIRYTDYSYAIVSEYNQLHEDVSAIRAAESALQFAAKHQLRNPALAGEFEQFQLRHRVYLGNKQSQKSVLPGVGPQGGL